MLVSMIKTKHIRSASKETLYLSPLPENIDPLPSSLKSFVALPEVDYEFDKAKDIDETTQDVNFTLPFIPEPASSVAEPLHLASEPLLRNKPPLLRSATEPALKDSRVPKVSSGLSLTAPTGSDLREHETSRPFVRIPDVQGASHRSNRHSSPSTFRPPPATPQQPIPDREPYTRDRGRSFVLSQNEPEQLRSQLHDLLSNPVSSSLPNISHFPSVVPVPAQPSSPPSRTATATARPTPPPPPCPATNPPKTVTPPISHSHTPHNSAATRPVISHASSAALALEKERQKAEQERQKEKERQKEQRRQLTAGVSSNSLREPMNVHSISSVQGSTRRDLTNVYGTSTVSGSSSSLRDAISSAHVLSHGNNGSSLRDTTNAYATTQLHRHQSLVNGKKRLGLQSIFA